LSVNELKGCTSDDAFSLAKASLCAKQWILNVKGFFPFIRVETPFLAPVITAAPSEAGFFYQMVIF
jgi:hypothetical protein